METLIPKAEPTEKSAYQLSLHLYLFFQSSSILEKEGRGEFSGEKEKESRGSWRVTSLPS